MSWLKRITIGDSLKALPLLLVGCWVLGMSIGFSFKALGKVVYIPFFPNIIDFSFGILAGLLLVYLGITRLTRRAKG